MRSTASRTRLTPDAAKNVRQREAGRVPHLRLLLIRHHFYVIPSLLRLCLYCHFVSNAPLYVVLLRINGKKEIGVILWRGISPSKRRVQSDGVQ